MNPNRRTLASGLLALLTLAVPVLAQAPPPGPSGSFISYQGRLTDANGTTVADGIHQGVVFRIYEEGAVKFQQTRDIHTVNGVFTVWLGGGLPGELDCLPAFDPAKNYNIGITIGGQELDPRQKITSVPMAQVAASLQPGVNITAGQGVFSGKGTFGGGVGVDMRETPDSIAINGAGSQTGVAGFSPSGAGVEGYSPQGDAISAWSTSGNLFKGSSVGTNQAVAWIDRDGKGTFKGGVESDTQGQGIVTAVNGNSDWTGVRGYSPAATGVWAETQSGRAIYAAAHGGGSIFEGFRLSDRVVRIDKDGKGFFNGGTQTGGADYADLVTVKGRSSDYQPGDVMVISDDPARPFTRSAKPYARNVAGIYSTKPGVVGSKRGIADPADNEIPLALTGIVPCKVTCQNGPIRMGDLLVASSTPGYAMKGTDPRRMVGAVVGKALQPLAKGQGVIEVLVTLR
jgi:hypothetical protein